MKFSHLKPVLMVLALGACSFIVDSQIKDMEPGPDFDPAECAVWGSVFAEQPGSLNIVQDVQALNGEGALYVYLNARGATPDATPYLMITGESIDLSEPHYYCIHEQELGGLTEGLFTAILQDDMTGVLEGNAFPYRAIMTDPFLYQILSAYRHGLTTYLSLTDLYWDGTRGARVDVPLPTRVSRLQGWVLFSESFPAVVRPGVNARICAYAVSDTGLDDIAVRYSWLGTRVIDLQDNNPVSRLTMALDFNVAAGPGQAFSVILVYLEQRNLMPETAPCGGMEDIRSCVLHEVVMDPSFIGDVLTDPDPYLIEPATRTCDIDF